MAAESATRCFVGLLTVSASSRQRAAAVFSRALGELEHLVRALGGRIETVLGVAGAGDLFVTCQGGRNGRMGRLLSRGLTHREAKAKHMPDDTVEGADPGARRGADAGRVVGERSPGS